MSDVYLLLDIDSDDDEYGLGIFRSIVDDRILSMVYRGKVEKVDGPVYRKCSNSKHNRDGVTCVVEVGEDKT
jgi:hypothetical protein